MPRESGDFQISELLKITAENKYAASVAAFEVVDNSYMIELPSKWSTRKAAVQAMMALSRDIVQFDSVTDEQRAKLEAELQNSPHRDSAEALFRSSAGAPVMDDSEDDLDEIGEVFDEKMAAEQSDDSGEVDSNSDDADDIDDTEDDDD
ncbi:MAG: hypothetical protein H3C43_07565 [Leptonema sp. (in: Bacteria)]|nr:hypothetical protein [Leptonema sp. (in: bacteria)]